MMNKSKKIILALGVAAAIATGTFAVSYAAEQGNTAPTKTFRQCDGTGKGGGMNIGNRGGFDGQRGEFRKSMNPDRVQNHAQMLELLKIDDATFYAERRAGKSLATMAQERGVAPQALKDMVIAHMNARIDQGVTSGRLTAEQASTFKTQSPQKAEEFINNKGPIGPRGKDGNRQDFRHQARTQMLDLFKMDLQAFRAERQAGKSLATIAQERGVAPQTVKNMIIERINSRIDQRVANGRLSAEQAATLKAQSAERAETIMNATGPIGPRGAGMKDGNGPKDGKGMKDGRGMNRSTNL